MKERPIIFSGEMVRAILDGRKTMTRRTVDKRFQTRDFVRLQNTLGYPASEGFVWAGFGNPADPVFAKCPYGTVGDRLWVREVWGASSYGRAILVDKNAMAWRLVYGENTNPQCRWSPIHMPRWASRITLEITEVRVERLQDITVNDVRAEGVEIHSPAIGAARAGIERTFGKAWNKINGKKHPWAENPWVWVIKFEVVK